MYKMIPAHDYMRGDFFYVRGGKWIKKRDAAVNTKFVWIQRPKASLVRGVLGGSYARKYAFYMIGPVYVANRGEESD